MTRDYDLIILGSGPAGFACAMQATKFDKKALIIEANEENLGGSWINTGTVPSKALRETAKNIYSYTSKFGDFHEKKPYERFKMRDVLKYKDKVLANENNEIKKNLIKNNVHTSRGFGKIIDANTIEITDHLGSQREVTADYILVSTGAQPKPPESFKVDHNKVHDINSILNMQHIPRRISIVGGNIQSIEFATIFASLGTKVTILNENADFLSYIDYEIRDEFQKVLDLLKISLVNGVKIQNVSKNELRNCTEIRYTKAETDELMVLETEVMLYFGGRIPNSKNIGLEALGVEMDEQGYIKVNKNHKTNVDSIYAAGDVVGFPALASVSFSQGRIAACDMFGIPSSELSVNIPFGIYSIPEIASIGLTEKEAIKQGFDVTVGRSYYNNLTKADISKNRIGLLKLVFETKTFKLLGVHICGEEACELIHIGQSVLFYNGDIRFFIQNVMNYPTYSEAYKVAAFNGVNRVYKAGAKYKDLLNK